MPKKQQIDAKKEQNHYYIEPPLPSAFKPYRLVSENLILLQLRAKHIKPLSKVSSTLAKSSPETFIKILKRRIIQNHKPFDAETKKLSQFTWVVASHNELAGIITISPLEGRTAFGVGINSLHGHNITTKAIEMIIDYLGEEIPYLGISFSQNVIAGEIMEQVKYADGNFVFYRDANRQNVADESNKHLPPRDFFISKRENKFSFFSFSKNKIIEVDEPNEIEQKCSEVNHP